MAQCPKLVINHWLGCQKEYRVDKEHCTLEMEAWAAYCALYAFSCFQFSLSTGYSKKFPIICYVATYQPLSIV